MSVLQSDTKLNFICIKIELITKFLVLSPISNETIVALAAKTMMTMEMTKNMIRITWLLIKDKG